MKDENSTSGEQNEWVVSDITEQARTSKDSAEDLPNTMNYAFVIIPLGIILIIIALAFVYSAFTGIL